MSFNAVILYNREGTSQPEEWSVKDPFLITHSNFFVAIFSSAAGPSQNSGECPVDTLLFRWENDKLPSQEEVMEIFHFNTNLQLDVNYRAKAVSLKHYPRFWTGMCHWFSLYTFNLL